MTASSLVAGARAETARASNERLATLFLLLLDTSRLDYSTDYPDHFFDPPIACTIHRMLSASPAGAARRVKAVVSCAVAFLLHCSWVLLNGSTVLGRLWSVAGEPSDLTPVIQRSSRAKRLTSTASSYASVGAFPAVLWVLAFKKGVGIIPINSRPSVRLTFGRDEVLLSPQPNSALRWQIHIDLLPAWNDFILHPYGVMLLTISLLPLARFLWLGRWS